MRRILSFIEFLRRFFRIGNATAFFIFLTLFVPCALAEKYGVFTYRTDGKSVTITSGPGEAFYLDIPESIRGLPVTSIGAGAFSHCVGLAGINIPASVTSIEEEAFSGCIYLTSISIPGKVKSIEKATFKLCMRLTQVTLPDSVTSIGDSAFAGCGIMTEIHIPDSVTSIGDSAFLGCGTADIQLPSSLKFMGDYAFSYSGITTLNIPSGLAVIGNYAFSSCLKLTVVSIPAGVISIGNGSFSDCAGLGSITIPDTVSSIGDSAFYKCGLPSVSLPAGLTTIGKSVFMYCPNLTAVSIPAGVTSIGDSAFMWCTSLSDVSIPSGVVSIGEGAFDLCVAMTGIHLPKDLTSIGASAFSRCFKLTEVSIPDGVTSIGRSAFLECTSLAGISIPDSVFSIGDSAFRGCTALTRVTIPEKVTAVGIETFSGCTSLFSVDLFENIKSIGAKAFSGCSKLVRITIPNSVLTIEDATFFDCSNLTEITLPQRLVSIGNSAFQNCQSLVNVSIPESVAIIRDTAFMNCSSLRGISLPAEITSLGGGTFSGCASLTGILLPRNIKSLDAGIFYGCTNLTTINIPSKVTTIGYYAFHNSGLTGITIPSSVTAIEESAFRDCVHLANVIIPESVTSIGAHAFSGCGLLVISIPNSVTAISVSAFSDCASLTSITLPSGVTTIGDSAFSGCTGLASISIPDSITSIGIGAFSGCTGLTSLTIPGSITSLGTDTFADCTGLASISILGGLTSIGPGVFRGCTSLTTISIANTVTALEDYAFYGCSSLAGITIPASVTVIGAGTFSACTSLACVTFEGNAPSAGMGAFPKPPQELTVVVLPGRTGFTFPLWQGVPSILLTGSEPPFVVLKGGALLPHNSTQSFEALVPGAPARSFSILNTGSAPQSFVVSLEEGGSPAFSVSAMSPSGMVAPWTPATFTATFRPLGTGPETAVLNIAGSPAGGQLFRLNLRGTALTPLQLVQSAYLKASQTGQAASFGKSIAVSGDTVVVGAPYEKDLLDTTAKGAVHIFVKSGTGWSHQARLTGANSKNGDLFGSSVAIDGDTVVVGAVGETSSNPGVNPLPSGNSPIKSGAAYVFTRNGSSWTQQAWMKGSHVGQYEFGNAVSISGDTVAVSAWREDNYVRIGPNSFYAPASGAVYLYTRSNGAWSQASRLTAPQPGGDDAFGGALGISGGTMVIGVPGDDSSATGINGDQFNNAMGDSGAAYVFVMNGSGWIQQAYLKASNTSRWNGFGQSVGIAGNTIVIGSPGEDSKSSGVNGDQGDRSLSGAGSAYVFVRERSVWSQQAYLKASNTANQARFGWSASVSGDTIVVGADQENRTLAGPINTIAPNSGAAYVFQRTGIAWFSQSYLKASNADASDRFGTSTAVSGNVIAVGAPNEASTATGVDGDQSGNERPGAGAAYLFEASLNPSPPVVTVTVPVNRTVTYADTVILHAEVSAFSFPTFQWYLGGTGDTSHPIPGANWKTLATPPITTSVTYWLRATNSAGSADSPTITVNPVQSPLQLWRTDNFGYPDNTGTAADTSDPDGDGSSNLDEFIAGTVPTDHTDAFGIISCGFQGQDTFTVKFFGRTGRTYQLVRSTEPGLAVRFWQPVAALESAASDGPVELTDSKASAARIFYRVIVSKP